MNGAPTGLVPQVVPSALANLMFLAGRKTTDTGVARVVDELFVTAAVPTKRPVVRFNRTPLRVTLTFVVTSVGRWGYRRLSGHASSESLLKPAWLFARARRS